MKRALAVAAGGGIALAPVLLTGTASAAGRPGTVYVSPSGTPGAADTSCQSAAYKVIDGAIEAVDAGGTVVVCKGTYEQTANVGKTLTLLGRPGAVIDQPPPAGGVGVQVTADYVTVRGLTLEHGDGGIVVRGNHATITGNKVLDVNEGHPGAGIGIAGGSYSRISNNMIDGAAGFGIALSDIFGPATSHNEVTGNRVEGTTGLTGIVLQSYSGGGGVSDNVVRNNVVDNSTVAPDAIDGRGGAGVVLGTADWPCMLFNCTESTSTGGSSPAAAGSGVYNNTVEGNRISGNGWPGVMVIGAPPDSGQDMNGNVITSNTIGTNNLLGINLLFLSTEVPETTGILVASPTQLSIQVSNNTIRSNHYGIWMNDLVDASGLNTNHFGNVAVPVYPPPTP